MDPVLILILSAAVILIFAVIMWTANRRRRESALEMMRAKSTKSAPAADTIAKVLALMAQGQKLEAIRVLREATGMGLADAKAAAEQLQARGDMEAPAAEAPSEQPPAEIEAAARELLRRGGKIAAIKLVREKMKLDLKDAKDLVDRLE